MNLILHYGIMCYLVGNSIPQYTSIKLASNSQNKNINEISGVIETKNIVVSYHNTRNNATISHKETIKDLNRISKNLEAVRNKGFFHKRLSKNYLLVPMHRILKGSQKYDAIPIPDRIAKKILKPLSYGRRIKRFMQDNFKD
ncbi:hypothetical protein K1T71_007660 [Dendrolimus kikuchii]|uniref:Uncharacterized protein n=1 Tax=Dendrolimus kikuchii TaxID=765133 RepID=A0ACC1CY24_9NEOP|nr:hypothetical protein K1T71_007660 [Dendrolimus kikuchii]